VDQKPNLHIPVKRFASVSEAGDCPRADVAVDACGTAAAAGGKPGKLIPCCSSSDCVGRCSHCVQQSLGFAARVEPYCRLIDVLLSKGPILQVVKG
jgi:hypothetical protein